MVSPTSADVFRQSDFDDGEIYKDDKAEDAALARNWKKKGMLRTVERHRRTKLEGCDRVCDRIALVCEVACCEQPAACLEALCRCPGYLLGSLLLYVLSVLVCVSRGCDCDAGGRVSAGGDGRLLGPFGAAWLWYAFNRCRAGTGVLRDTPRAVVSSNSARRDLARAQRLLFIIPV